LDREEGVFEGSGAARLGMLTGCLLGSQNPAPPNWKRAYPLSRDPWDSETESHRNDVTSIGQGGFWSGHCRKSSRTLGAFGPDTIVIAKQPDGKMKVTSGAWDGEKII
jgi:hypothetical protein